MATFKWQIDFERNRDYTDFIDDISPYVISATCNLGMRKAYQDVADGGELRIVVENVDGRFSPENSSSPLYGYLLPNRIARMTHIKDDGTETILWSGRVKDYQFSNRMGLGDDPYNAPVTILCTDTFDLLKSLEAYLGILENVTYDEVIQQLLPQTAIPASSDTDFWILGYPGSSELGETTYLGDYSSFSDLEVGLSVIPEYGDITSGDAIQIIADVLATERGKFFFDRTGKAIGWNRHHLIDDITNDATVDNSGIEIGYPLKNYYYTYGDNVSNVVRIQLHPRNVGTNETLWELDTPVEINGNSVKTLEIILRRSNGQFAASGSLTAGTPNFSQGTASVDVSARGGRGVVTITNSASAPAIMTALAITGTPQTNQNQIVIEVSDEDSIASYGRANALNIDMKAVSNYSDAEDIANFELFRRKDPFGMVHWVQYERQYEVQDDSHLVDWEIGTRLSISIPEKYHTGEYFIMGEEHSVNIRSKLHTCKFYLEPAATSEANQFWYLEDSNSQLGVNTYLGY